MATPVVETLLSASFSAPSCVYGPNSLLARPRSTGKVSSQNPL
jgi:hypothetical protein